MSDKELLAISERIVAYIDNGDPAKDVIEQTAYTENEVLYQLARFYVQKMTVGA